MKAWRWYYENVGLKRCTVVDTYWQTETGGHIITNIPGKDITEIVISSYTGLFYLVANG